jgi:hypothetical protein
MFVGCPRFVKLPLASSSYRQTWKSIRPVPHRQKLVLVVQDHEATSRPAPPLSLIHTYPESFIGFWYIILRPISQCHSHVTSPQTPSYKHLFRLPPNPSCALSLSFINHHNEKPSSSAPPISQARCFTFGLFRGFGIGIALYVGYRGPPGILSVTLTLSLTRTGRGFVVGGAVGPRTGTPRTRGSSPSLELDEEEDDDECDER